MVPVKVISGPTAKRKYMTRRSPQPFIALASGSQPHLLAICSTDPDLSGNEVAAPLHQRKTTIQPFTLAIGHRKIYQAILALNFIARD
jgi:hypothetical protein